MHIRSFLVAATAFVALSSAAQAQTEVTAWTDLNLRAGPGTQYPIIGVIPANGQVTVDGCLETASWCKVFHAGAEGWASGDYLTSVVDTVPMAIYPNRARFQTKTIVYSDTSDESTAAGGATGAVAGAIVGGPVGAVVGAIVGAGAGAAIDPGPTVTTYVRENPRDPVFLDGEVVVGAGIPDTVTLSEIPGSTYYYAYVNGVPVIVEGGTRRIVQIVR